MFNYEVKTNVYDLNLFQNYADEGHELKGVLEHVYRSMEDFLQECLSLDTEEAKVTPDT